MGAPTTLCFDLDNTLLDDDASLRACVRKVCDDLVSHLQPFDADAMAHHYITLSDAYWLNLGKYDPATLPETRLRFWSETLAAFGCDDPKVATLSRDAYSTYRYEFSVVYDDTEAVLAGLHRHFRLAVITNGVGEQQRARIRSAGLDKYFDAVVASTDVGAGKPDAAVFEHTLNLVGADPRETWHIGDSLSADVQGAYNAGLAAAVWLNRHAAQPHGAGPRPHHEVDSLVSFANLLDRYAS